ncbi:hypothetical protein ACT3TS_07245 [Specibacter sp. AOP5-B1-6]|uniref:hypothetical protein n=1 Tax=Specibacter sp. AOP5-B1-6 TaxID=3457653 RepID=UPI00402B165F
MSKNSNFAGPTRLADSLTGRPVRQYTVTGHYYVRATATRHFWGRILDSAVFLAAFLLFSLLLVVVQVVMESSAALRDYAPEDSFFIVLIALAWFPALYIYGMIWGKWGLPGDRAAHMRSVRIKDGTISGPWIGGWRAILWSFFPFYVVILIASLFDGGSEHDPGYIPFDLDSGIALGHPPVADAALIAREEGAARAETEADARSRADLPNLYGTAPDGRP